MRHTENNKVFSHTGRVDKVSDKSVSVTVSSQPACSGCQAEGHCTIVGNEDRTIEIPGKYEVKPGEIVTVLIKQSMGYMALFFGYVFPLIAVLVIMAVLTSLHVAELITGLISVGILIPYYFIIFFLRKRINSKFKFTLKT